MSARSTLDAVGGDRVRALQHVLYRAAKADQAVGRQADGKRRFHALFDKIHRRDVMERAWEQVRANRGAHGVDRVTLAMVEEYGVARLLTELITDLRTDRYRPLPARRVFIPKPGSGEKRPLSIPAVRDRIVQAATKIVLEPIFEADFLPCSFGFRPKRRAHDALQVLLDGTWQGRRVVVETDIASCFEAIPHDRLIQAVEERISDRKVLRLLRIMLRAGVLEDGSLLHRDTGTPQGGVISPLLCNVYLHQLDRAWRAEDGELVRYADDLVVLCSTRRQAEAALARLTALLADLGLEPKAAKTRIVHLREGGKGPGFGFDFLGFHHRLIRARRPNPLGKRIIYLARWPSRKAIQHARDRIRQITSRTRLWLGNEEIVGELNRFLRGWAGYFRYGNSARHFHKIRQYALERIAGFVAKRHKHRWSWGLGQVAHSPNHYGLINLYGIVRAPRVRTHWAGQAERRR